MPQMSVPRTPPWWRRPRPPGEPSWKLMGGVTIAVLTLCCGAGIVADIAAHQSGQVPASVVDTTSPTPAAPIAVLPTATTSQPVPTPFTPTAVPPTTEPAAPAPTTGAPPPVDPTDAEPDYQHGVHPGAFCSPGGAFGYTDAGKLMECKPSATDSRDRWRAA